MLWGTAPSLIGWRLALAWDTLRDASLLCERWLRRLRLWAVDLGGDVNSTGPAFGFMVNGGQVEKRST